jgi:hypothetical protein
MRELSGEKVADKCAEWLGLEVKASRGTSRAQVDRQIDELAKISAPLDYDLRGAEIKRRIGLSKQTLSRCAGPAAQEAARTALDVKQLYQSARRSSNATTSWGCCRTCRKKKIRGVKSLAGDRKGVLASS